MSIKKGRIRQLILMSNSKEAKKSEDHEKYEGRTKLGRFKPGFSGNPKGKTRTDPLVKELLKANSLEAAQKLVELLDSENDKIAFMAAQEILNRTEGKPNQSLNMEVTGELDVYNVRTQIRAVLLEGLNAGHGAEDED